MRLVVTAAVVLSLLAAGVPAARATPSQQLADARGKFRSGDCRAAIPLLSGLLYPTPSLADAGEITEAHVLLGVCYFETGSEAQAAKEFEEALYLDETISLDPLLYSEEVVEFFDRTKQSLAGKLAEYRERRRLAEENEAYRRALENALEVVTERRPYYVNFIPFGAGQFQNGHRTKGAILFGVQATLGGASVGLALAQVLKWGFPLEVPREDEDEARTLQILQVGTGGLFLVAAAYGIIDALAYYQPTVTVTRRVDPRLLPPDSLRPPESSAFRILPLAGPDRAGVVLHWEF